MPTYEYECAKCGHRFEAFQRMSDPKLEDCPRDDCHGRVRRLIGTGAGIIFKGSGFYETDYKRDSSGKEKNNDGKEKKADSKEKSADKASKPETKPGDSKPAGSSGATSSKSTASSKSSD